MKAYAIYLDPVDGGFELPNGECSNAANHTPSPALALHKIDWAEEKLRTHRQIQCPDCGLYVIWVARRRRMTGQLPSKRND